MPTELSLNNPPYVICQACRDEHKQGDGTTDRSLVFDGTGKLESTEGISFWRTSSVKGENQTGREAPSKPPS